MEEPFFKTVMPDGKIAVTLLVSDLEVANELFRIAKQNAIEVLEAEQSVTKSAGKEVLCLFWVSTSLWT